MERENLIHFVQEEIGMFEIQQILSTLDSLQKEVETSNNTHLINTFEHLYNLSLEILSDRDLLVFAIELWYDIYSSLTEEISKTDPAVLGKITSSSKKHFHASELKQKIIPIVEIINKEERTYKKVCKIYKAWLVKRDKLISDFESMSITYKPINKSKNLMLN